MDIVRSKREGIWGIGLALLLSVCLGFAGCGQVTVSEQRIRDLDYTVLSEEKLPEELGKIIESKRETPFKMTFQDDGYLYVCQGYGMQKTGGYCIQVTDLYETRNAVCFKAMLMGPSPSEPVTGQPSFPYIVIKTEYLDKTVVFE